MLLLVPVLLDLVDLTQLSDCLEELICGTGHLWLEECQPEDKCIHVALQLVSYFLSQTIVYNIFEINRVQFIGPWMKNLETLMVHLLVPESGDVILDEAKVGLVSLYWIAQVILVDLLLVVTKE